MNVEYLLTFVVCGRNDSYLGNFKYRITSALNYLVENSVKIRRAHDIEILVVDWNSECPLHEELDLISEAEKMVKFLIVPPSTAARYHTEGNVFNTTCAFNTGIRRSKGRYVAIMSADVLMPPESLHNLLSILDRKVKTIFEPEKTLMIIERKFVHWYFEELKIAIGELDRYLHLHENQLEYKKNTLPGLPGGAGAILLSRELWQKSEGFDECLDGWGWFDQELGLRVNQFYPSVYSSNFGVLVYDILQSPQKRKSIVRYNKSEVRSSFETGNKNWGLFTNLLEIKKAEGPKDKKHGVPSQEPSPKIQNRQDVFRNLTDPSIYRQVFADPVGFRFLRVRSDNEWACLHALMGLMKSRLFKKYLEYGIRETYTAAMAAEFNPILEIYGIDDWHQYEGPRYNRTPLYTSIMIRDRGFEGYLRYIAGNVNTALERLKNSFMGSMSFDLVLFRIDMFKDKAFFHLKQVIEYLEKDGALILTSSNHSLFNEVLRKMRNEYSECEFIVCKKYKTGILLKTENAATHPLPDYEKEEKALAASWKPKRMVTYMYDLLVNIYKVYARIRSIKTWTV